MMTQNRRNPTCIAASALTGALMLAASAAPAAAAPPEARAPLRPYAAKSQDVPLTVYGRAHEVVRSRTDGAKLAKFEAEPMVLDRNTLVVFEVRSESAKGSVPRWRCVAVEDVSECFDGPRAFRWIGSDERMVLRVVAEDRRSPKGDRLFAEAMKARIEAARVAAEDRAR